MVSEMVQLKHADIIFSSISATILDRALNINYSSVMKNRKQKA